VAPARPMRRLAREHKFFMGGFLSGFLFYTLLFFLGFYLRLRGLM